MQVVIDTPAQTKSIFVSTYLLLRIRSGVFTFKFAFAFYILRKNCKRD